MRLVELRQLFLARRRDGRHDRDREGDDIGDALFVAVLVERLDQRARRLDPGGDRLQQVVARNFLAHPRDELVFADAVHHQHLREQAAIELAVRSAKGRVFVDRVADEIVRHDETEPLGFLVQQIAVDQLIERAVHKAELLDELHVDGAAELAAHPLDGRLQRTLQFGGRDLLVADRRDDGFLRAAVRNR